MKKSKSSYDLYIGNRLVTRLKPQHFKTQKCVGSLPLFIDGKLQNVAIASETDVTADFKVKADDDLRVNIIGFTDPGNVNENDRLVAYNALNQTFSLDIGERRYRIELYRNDSFCGMVTVQFK